MTTQYNVLFTLKDNTTLERRARAKENIKMDTEEKRCVWVWVGEQQSCASVLTGSCADGNALQAIDFHSM